MKKQLIFIMSLCFALGIQAQSLFVGTYNVRYFNQEDTEDGNGWGNRCPVICSMINFENPDIFGTQEAKSNQIYDLKKGLDGYDYIGIGRDDGKEEGEYSAIFYKKDKLQLLRSGNFWLNENTTEPTLGWDAACVRICTWGKFKDKKTKLKFYYFNLHMDHVGVVARRESAKLVIRKIKELAENKAAVILTGDFNVDQNDETFRIFSQSGILKDSYSAAKFRFAENGTFNSFDTDLKSNSRIDHVFVSPMFEVQRYGILTNGYWTPNGNAQSLSGKDAPKEIEFKAYTHRAPSDHYPVLVKIEYKK